MGQEKLSRMLDYGGSNTENFILVPETVSDYRGVLDYRVVG